MTIKVNPNTCPKCGAVIPNDAPQGLCPKCVLLGAAATDAGLLPTATGEIPSLERVAAAFPQLQIIELLGRGGMGFVFKARQPNLDRFVALKLLPDKLARDPHFAERFGREARVLARLNHPGIVTIFDFGHAGGCYFLLMEYVDGVNLRQAMRAGKFSPAAALAVVPKICEALQFAHEQGVLHRDIKPENILLDTKGRVKIADFGIAKLVGDEQPDLNLTATGATIGTPQYMAPEQLEQPGTVDHRADIYSLGVVFYEMLTGELPIGRFAPPSQRTPLDPRVDEVVMRTLEKEREKRYQSAGEVKTTVEHLTEPQVASAVVTPPAVRRGILKWVFGALLLALLGSVITWWSKTRPTTRSLSSEASAPEVTVAVIAPPREMLIITGIVLSNGVPVTGQTLRAKLWPPSGKQPSPYLVQWKLAEGAPWEIVIEEATSRTIAARLRPANLPELDWSVSPSATNVSKLAVTREARTIEVARALQTFSGSQVGAVDWSVRIQLQSSPHSTASSRGIKADFVLPANQVAIFELVTRSNGVMVPVPDLAAYHINGMPETYTGKFILADDPDDLDSLTGLPRWTFGIVGPDGRLAAQGLAVPQVPPNFNLSSSLWKELQPDTEVVAGLSDSASGGAAYGLRIRTQAFTSKPGLRHSSSGYGTNWLLAAAPHLASMPTNAAPRISFTFTAVELREVDGKRWLAIDYLDQAQGDCRKSFPWEAKIPGFKAEIRTSEFAANPADPAAARHQRVEYLLPDGPTREQLEQLRQSVEKALKQKTIRLGAGEQRVLFEFGSSSDTALKAWLKVMPPQSSP